MTPEISYLQECFSYNADTGALCWKTRPRSHFANDRACSVFNARYAGTEAGSANAKRAAVKVSNRLYKVHRIAWAIFYGEHPTQQIDHINGDPLDNRIANLRLATNQQNQYNRGVNKNSTSGLKGVYWDKPVQRWRAQIVHNRASVFLGHYATSEEAAAAYAEGAKRYAREFARVE